jgi:hypothetical protein
MGYAKQIFGQASDALHKDGLTIQARLCGVASLFVGLDERDFPNAALRSEFTSLMEAMSVVQSQIEAVARAMDDETARCLADRIHKLSSELEDQV